MRPTARALASLQGAYFALTGLWALVSISTFMAVTGPKTDAWLVKTVGVLVLVIGVVLLQAARRGAAASPEARTLAVACAMGLAAIDVVYVSTSTISPVYLLDAVVEIGFVLLWGLARRDEAGERPATPVRRPAHRRNLDAP